MNYKLLFCLLFFLSVQAFSQTFLVIHKSDGTKEKIAIEEIRKVTFDMSVSSSTQPKRMPAVKGFNRILQKILPGNHLVRIDYTVEKAADVQISVFDVKGRMVSTLLRENKKPGIYSLKWNGTAFGGKKLSTGSYIIQVKINDALSHSLVILK